MKLNVRDLLVESRLVTSFDYETNRAKNLDELGNRYKTIKDAFSEFYTTSDTKQGVDEKLNEFDEVYSELATLGQQFNELNLGMSDSVADSLSRLDAATESLNDIEVAIYTLENILEEILELMDDENSEGDLDDGADNELESDLGDDTDPPVDPTVGTGGGITSDDEPPMGL